MIGTNGERDSGKSVPAARLDDDDTKLHPVVRLQFWRSGECGITSLLPLLSYPLYTKVIMFDRGLSMGQIELFKIY